MKNRKLLNLFMLVTLVACSSMQKTEDNDDDSVDQVSLRADRSHLDELRQEIPEKTQRENDELALIRGLMSQGDQETSVIREKFSRLIRDRRDKFDKVQRRSREEYSRREKSRRSSFLAKLKSEREDFLRQATGKKIDPDTRRQFFDEQEARRQDYFSDERENRRDFESNATDQRKAFEDYIREKQNQFNQELRDYSDSLQERRKASALQRRHDPKAASAQLPSVQDPALEEFKSIPSIPATPLSSGSDDH